MIQHPGGKHRSAAGAGIYRPQPEKTARFRAWDRARVLGTYLCRPHSSRPRGVNDVGLCNIFRRISFHRTTNPLSEEHSIYARSLSAKAISRRRQTAMPAGSAEAPARFDAVVADRALALAAGKFAGEWLDLPHFAVSGRLMAAV